MRNRIYEMIEPADGNNKISSIYDYCMLIVIVISLVPLAFKNDPVALVVIDKVCASVFIVDYILRWITADYKFGKKSVTSFIKYPFSLMAIIDLISVLPSITIINSGFKLLRVFRMIKTLRVFRVFKALRYSKSMKIIANVLKNSKESLVAVGTFAVAYILVAALVIFNVEPESFDTFFDAVYWATVSLTTVGYGDIYPITTIGRVVTMISSVFGIAIVALPAGIVTAGYMNEISSEKEDEDEA